ncbi:MAG: hypothetical protein D6737_16880 [Chloroflexi bacterium]|nr:MAG: hypothetical protein CUN54_04380 [Phototrophicales bacterium]RMF77734.1 MAG: hypothetical protein D6737_16880 [Chloroflexota bacterium]
MSDISNKPPITDEEATVTGAAIGGISSAILTKLAGGSDGATVVSGILGTISGAITGAIINEITRNSKDPKYEEES